MRSSNRALSAVHALAQFELIEVAEETALAVKARTQAQGHVDLLTQQCHASVSELRAAMSRQQVNPALIQQMRRLYRAEQLALAEWRSRLIEAQQREEQAYTALGRVRNRERSMERAMQAERHRQQLKRQMLEIALADELWLQQRSRESS
ncbi:MAG TPA: hypothetical protein VIU34_30045 [Steroidobacter sp.]